MFKKILFFIFLLMTLKTNAQDLRFSVDDSDFYFTAKFLKTAFKNSKDNFVVSPLSVYIATTLLANGAEDSSKEELKKILTSSLDMDIDGIDSLNKKLAYYIIQKNNSIKTKNTLFGKKLRPDYIEKMEKELYATVDEQKGETQKLKIVNEVKFKDYWLHPFKEYLTSVKEFYSLDGQIDKVDMMYVHEREVDYYQDEEMQAIRLPYKNGNVMHIFLPKEGINFNEFIEKLSADKLYLEYKVLPTEIFIPKFTCDYENKDMISFYNDWGVQEIFSGKANFRKLSDISHFVESITHKARIETNERGTEALAMTQVTLKNGAVINRKLEPRKWKMHFNANRPFVFMINNGDFIGVYLKGKHSGGGKLMYALNRKAEYSAIETLIKAGADVNYKDEEGRTPLMIYANRYGSETKILDLLIKSGADINAADDNGVTSLMRSVANGNSERIQTLLKNGANVHLKDKWGNTLLMYANMGSCSPSSTDNIEVNDENIDEINGRDNMCREGGIRGVSLDTIKLLLSFGLEINDKNNLGMTPLMFCVIYKGNINIVKELIKAGADIQTTDNKGNSILLYAKHLKKEIYEYLLSLGLKPEDIQGKNLKIRVLLKGHPQTFPGEWMEYN